MVCSKIPIDSSLMKASDSLSKSLVGEKKFCRERTILKRAVETFSTDWGVLRYLSMCSLGASHSMVGIWNSLKISTLCVCRLTLRIICKIFYWVNFSQKSKTMRRVEMAGEFKSWAGASFEGLSKSLAVWSAKSVYAMLFWITFDIVEMRPSEIILYTDCG